MIEIVFVLIIIGVVLWVVNQHVPMAPPIKTLLNVVVILCVAWWLLQKFGVVNGGPGL